jgi:hypothetical protein
MSQDTGFEDANTPSAATFGELETEATFANSSLADDTNHATIALDGMFEFMFKGGKLIVPAGEATEPYSASKHSA